jgi:hypothetical protein
VGAKPLVRGQQTFRSGPYLPRRARRKARRPLLVATGHDDLALADLVEHVLAVQLHHPYLKPVFLVGRVDTASLRDSGLQYESCLLDDELQALDLDVPSFVYRQGRIDTMRAIYHPHVVLDLTPEERPTAEEMTGEQG